jgi:DNA-binding NarL/FixJ family response regulator
MTAISILLVEDEAMTAMYMETFLRRKGYEVLKRVSTGEDAVYSVHSLKPDLVLMDIRLAGKMDGIESASKILSETDSAVQFIFTTGYTDVELKDRALLLNPLGFFIKPVNMPELIKTIESFFIKQNI